MFGNAQTVHDVVFDVGYTVLSQFTDHLSDNAEKP